MKRKEFNFDKAYGVVLEGGGAKGAYQIGVWKAFLECNVKIKGVAGVSVGALNGALMCMGDYDNAVDIWRNISYSRIMKVDDSQMQKLFAGKFKELNLQEVRKQSKSFLVGGGLDITPLKELIENYVDEKKIKESDMEFIMGTFSLSNLKEIEITAKESEEGHLKDYLMASAYFPLFKNEKLLGKTYLDGGIVNNVPIDMLINRGYKNIIVVRIFGVGVEKKIKIPEDVNVTYIAPKVNLCNVMEFNRKKAKRNITLGYYDAQRTLKSLEGNEYYIEAHRDENEYLASLLRIDEEPLRGLLSLYKRDNYTGDSTIRVLTEEIFPQIVTSFKIGKNWCYIDLYFSILEYCAKKLRIQKYKLYSEHDFCQLIEKRICERYQNIAKTDIFMDLALSIIKNDNL